MRILLINACHYLRGGSEIVYFNTAELLKKYGHEVIFFSTSNVKNSKSDFEKYFTSISNFRELSVLEKIGKAPSYIYNKEAERKLEQLIKDFRPDVAHVHIYYAVLSVSILKVLKRNRIPIIHTVHDYRLLCPVNTLIDRNGLVCEKCKDRHFYHCLMKRCSEGKIFQSLIVMLEAYFWKYFINPLNLIDHFIFVSRFSLAKHLEFNTLYESKYTHLYNFTNFTSQYNLPEPERYFLYIGRLSVEKGIKTLISAFEELENVKLVIAGTGPLKEMVENTSAKSPNIKYVGFKNGTDLETLIKNSFFIVLPSECYENNPLAIIEAYTFGKPVIGADIAGIPELIDNRKNGFLFKSGDPESLVLSLKESAMMTDQDYLSFSKSVYNFALNYFNAESHYLKLMKIYQDAIGKRNIE